MIQRSRSRCTKRTTLSKSTRRPICRWAAMPAFCCVVACCNCDLPFRCRCQAWGQKAKEPISEAVSVSARRAALDPLFLLDTGSFLVSAAPQLSSGHKSARECSWRRCTCMPWILTSKCRCSLQVDAEGRSTDLPARHEFSPRSVDDRRCCSLCCR